MDWQWQGAPPQQDPEILDSLLALAYCRAYRDPNEPDDLDGEEAEEGSFQEEGDAEGEHEDEVGGEVGLGASVYRSG